MIHVGLLAKNEAHRYLVRTLKSVVQFADRIVVLNDNSIDETAYISGEFGAEVYSTSKNTFTEKEATIRAMLFELIINKSFVADDDWIIILDADEEVIEPRRLCNFLKENEEKHKLYNSINKPAVLAFTLFDMWSDTEFRSDRLWNAHTRSWVMGLMHKKNREYRFLDKKLHCGRLPLFAFYATINTGLDILHWGWAKEKDRFLKYHRYLKLDGNGEYGIMEQYKSIIDDNPILINYEQYKNK